MTEEISKKRGGREGNQNARKHGFYSDVLSEAEQRDLELAIAVDGLDEEIALLRVKIKSVVENDPDNINLIMQGLRTLIRLVTTKYNLRGDDKQSIKETVSNLLKDIALPLGIGLGSVIKK